MTQKFELKRVRINPNNRTVDITDPAYTEAWVKAMEKIRAEYEELIKKEAEKGNLESPLEEGNPLADTPEGARRLLAHLRAEQAMQEWAVMRGIGMLGVSDGWDHGAIIEYIDDPSVAFLDYELEEPDK